MVDTLIDTTDINPMLNEIMLAELAGVVRYTHASPIVTGPNRLPLVAYMREQADESFRQLLGLSEGHSVHLEEYARTRIGAEELHVIEMNKLLRGPVVAVRTESTSPLVFSKVRSKQQRGQLLRVIVDGDEPTKALTKLAVPKGKRKATLRQIGRAKRRR